MSKLQTYLLAIAFVIMSMLGQSCTGYEDGPSVNFTSAEKKISSTWRVKEASLNEIDITGQFSDDFFAFEEDRTYKYFDAFRLVSEPPFTQDTLMPLNGLGEWQFVDGTKQVELLYTFSFKDPYNPDIRYNENVNELWTIQRLTSEELWLKNDSVFMKLTLF